MEVAVPSSFSNQLTSGALPKAGPPYLSSDSDTYHMWTMIITYNDILYTKDYDFLTQNWPRYPKAMEFVHDKITPAGIMNTTGQGD
ncbi:hypothetical protein VE03_08178 [Pseudogymnoascus sp. 23342-1-I1]|nr:hypothetical protein VE03_08178 [Pseudogymnoascus sp. 23342-1-I1]